MPKKPVKIILKFSNNSTPFKNKSTAKGKGKGKGKGKSGPGNGDNINGPSKLKP